MTALPCHVLIEQSGPTSHPDRHGRGGVRVFSKCRNEMLRLPSFLAHYRKLGASSFHIVDNASTDGTLEYLAGQPDVQVYSTDGLFREARGGTDWLNALLRRHGTGHWCLTVDIDELFRYPGSETTGLDQLTAYLESGGHQAMACLLLDMYPAGPLAQVQYSAGSDLIAAAPCFDSGPYKRIPYPECPGYAIYGGMRERVFYPESRADDLLRRLHVKLYHRVLLSIPLVRDFPPLVRREPVVPPCLTKIPLVYWDADTQYLNVNHFVSSRRVAAETGVLLHFKFLQDFHQRAAEEVLRKQYYDGAAEFVRYVAKLRGDANMVLADERSERFQDNQQLQRLGLMTDTPAWLAARKQASA